MWISFFSCQARTSPEISAWAPPKPKEGAGDQPEGPTPHCPRSISKNTLNSQSQGDKRQGDMRLSVLGFFAVGQFAVKKKYNLTSLT